MGARSGVGNLEYSTDREESKSFKLSKDILFKKKKKNKEGGGGIHTQVKIFQIDQTFF